MNATTLPVHHHGHHRTTDRLRRIHEELARRGPTVVLVTAPTGGGRSHLVDVLLTSLTGVTSVPVRSLPWEADVPMATAERVLRRLPRAADEVEGDVGATLLGALGTVGAGTVLVVDDADVADPDSLRALGSAVERTVDAPVLLVLTARSPSDGPSAGLARTLAHERLRLGPLDHTEIRDIVSARTGREPSAVAARRILDITGGHASTVTDVVDEAPEDWWTSPFSPPPLPDSARRETGARLARLDPADRAVIEAAAVLPPPVRLAALIDLVAAIGESPEVDVVSGPDPREAEPAVLAALDAAHRAGVVHVDLSPGAAVLAFASPLVRTAVLHEIAPRRRLALHRIAARLVADTDPDAALDHLTRIATGPDADLCRRLRERAGVHARAGHWSEAGHAYLTAARLTPDPDTARELDIDGIDALLGAGRISEASTLAHTLDRVRPDPRRDAVLGSLALHLGHAGEAETLLDRALRAGTTGDDRLPAPDPVSLAQKLVLDSLCRWRPDHLHHWAGVVTGSDRPDQPEVEEARAIGLLGDAIDAAPGAGPADENRLGGLAPAVAQRFEMASGWIALAGDDVETARRRLGSAVPTTDVSGSARISLWAQAWLARTHLVRGDWDDALRVVDTAARRIDHLELNLLAPIVHWSGAVIRSMRGDHLGAATHLRHLTTTPDAYPVQILPSAMGRMQVGAAAGDYSAVRRAAEPLHTLSEHVDIDQPGFWPWHDLYAHALVLSGRIDTAEALIGPPERRARELGHRSTLARLGAVRSRIAAVRGDVDECTRLFHQSIEYLDGLAMPYYAARMHFGHGQTLRRAGRRREAHLALGTARDLYEQLGARAYVERCDRERRAGGVDVTRTGGNATLTPQEQAVATLVAAGRTNGQAAEELFLSVKTVQYHLTRIYSKLGVSGRTELALHAARGRPSFGAEKEPPTDP